MRNKGMCSHSPACDEDCCRCEEYEKDMEEMEVENAKTLLIKKGYKITYAGDTNNQGSN